MLVISSAVSADAVVCLVKAWFPVGLATHFTKRVEKPKVGYITAP